MSAIAMLSIVVGYIALVASTGIWGLAAIAVHLTIMCAAAAATPPSQTRREP